MRHRRVVSPHFISNEASKILRTLGIDDDEIDKDITLRKVIDYIDNKINKNG